MRIAVFHHFVTRNNPAGHCLLKMIRGLYAEHDFTIFAAEFENPDPTAIRHVRVPAIRRPMAATFISYYVVSSVCWFYYSCVLRKKYDLILINETIVPFGDVSYSHFCHRRYLNLHWKDGGSRGLRGLFLRLAHELNAAAEPSTFGRMKHIVVPSWGLKRELSEQYPAATGKITVLPISVALEEMERPRDFERSGFRRGLRLGDDDVVFVFVALGHFERKGLPLLFEALGRIADPRARLIVVGGNPGLVADYRGRARAEGIADRVTFTGKQKDVRPYLWASDAFILPSLYEVFPAVALEAAAANLPLITTRLNGIEEFLREGENGWIIERNLASLTAGLERFCALDPRSRDRVGSTARSDVQAYSTSSFVADWSRFFSGLTPAVAGPCPVAGPCVTEGESP